MEPSDTIIKLRVGHPNGDTKQFNIHRGVLCKHSKFFQTRMQPQWTESREQPEVIDLHDDSVQTVSDYIKWLYTEKIQVPIFEADGEPVTARAKKAEEVFVWLAQAYVFGEKIIDLKYKNTLIRTVLAAKKSYGWNLGPESVGIVYEGTPPTSPFRRLVAESVANSAVDDSADGYGWMSFFEGYPTEALVDALKAIVKARPPPRQSSGLIESFLEEEEPEEE